MLCESVLSVVKLLSPLFCTVIDILFLCKIYVNIYLGFKQYMIFSKITNQQICNLTLMHGRQKRRQCDPEAETDVMGPEVNDCHNHQKLAEIKNRHSPKNVRENTPAFSTPRFQNCGFQNCERRNSCFLTHPVCGHLLWESQETLEREYKTLKNNG